MKKLFLLCFVFLNLFFISDCISQTTQGTVTDPFTKKGIPNITVTIGRNSAITDSLGFYKIDEITSINSKEQKNESSIPVEYSLSQNYPNPFNPITTIKYSLPIYSYVNISVFDVLGCNILQLVNEELPPGTYQIKFEGKNLSSGVYFYRIISGEFIQTKKFVLLK